MYAVCVSAGRSKGRRPLPSTPDAAAAATVTFKTHDERPGNNEYDCMTADHNDYATTPGTPYTDMLDSSDSPDSSVPFYLPIIASPENMLDVDDLFKEK